MYSSSPSLFVIVISLLLSILAVTSWFVIFSILYITVISGNSLSIQSTFAIALPSFPALSIKVNSNSPFSVNIYVFFPLLFVTVISSLASNVATTSFPVISVIS